MYICNVCGHLMDNLPKARVYGDNLLGGHIDETMHDCPHCDKGEMVEATLCKICGTPFDNTELHGVCENCLHEDETVGEALAIGAENPESVKGINGFIASVLPVEQMNKILAKWVEENFVDHSKSVVDYCEEDKDYYSEWLVDKYGN